MEHYNLIISKEDKMKLEIIATDSYLNLVKDNPGWLHSNEGDFYSNIVPHELAAALYDISKNIEMGNKRLSDSLEFVNEKAFDPEYADPKKNYLIQNMLGITMITSEEELKLYNSYLIKLGYDLLTESLIPGLFANDEGTLPKSIKELTTLIENNKTLQGYINIIKR